MQVCLVKQTNHTANECGRRKKTRPYRFTVCVTLTQSNPPVARVVRAGVVHPDNDEDMLKVRANSLGGERMSTGLLEHDGHDVVPDVAFPQQLAKQNVN